MGPGDHLNHYEIVAKLGAGGMGEVYIAHDSKLDRKVALKVLPEDLAADEERRNRFEREAKAVAALNHPNIVTIHSVEEAEGEAGTLHFLTMELVEGQTLDEVTPAGGMGLDRFFGIAIPLADALSAAHDKGIAHRDLKPGNVMVTEAGSVKLLDFGLAKLFEEPEVGLDDAATEMPTEHASASKGADLTEEGKILGTVAYMSPEQAEGKAIDHRSDVFSLGIMMYEMATGQRPFEGDTKVSVISAIVKDTPESVTELNTRLPRHLGRIIKRCLEKDITRRPQTALDVRNELEDLKGEVDSGEVLASGVHTAPAPAASAGLSGMVAMGIVAVAAVLGGLGWWAFTRNDELSAPRRAPSVTTTPVATGPTPEFTPAISPDGLWVVYGLIPAELNPDGSLPQVPPDLFLQSIDGQRTINLTNTPEEAEFMPVYSPDGRQIAYFYQGARGMGIRVMGTTGENARTLVENRALGSWFPDGESLAVAERGFINPRSLEGTSQLYRVNVATGEESLLFNYDGWTAMQPSVSPNGKYVAFWGLPPGGGQRDIYTVPVDGGDPIALTNDGALDFNAIWSPDGQWIYFSSERSGSVNIWRMPMDQETGRPTGEPEPITAGGLGEQFWLSLDSTGTRMIYMEYTQRMPVLFAEFDPETLTVSGDSRLLSQTPVRSGRISVSPDGQRVAYNSTTGQQDIFVADIDGSNERRVTNDSARDWWANWLDDNETLLFYSDAEGMYELYSIRADGSGRRKLATAPSDIISLAAATDGSYAASIINGADERALLKLGDDPDTTEVTFFPPVPDNGMHASWWDFSPDGRFILGESEGLVLYDIEAQSFERLTNEPASATLFTPDGGSVLVQTVADFGAAWDWHLLDLETREQRQLTLPISNIEEMVIVPGMNAVVYLKNEDIESDVWMLEIDEGGR